uniref:Hsp70h n=1 Tax=Grapevine leafroll-associated virus 2 TaxID=64003 RepID=A0A2I4PBV0_9CLOS|nr:Hsp70h [Grapevine leafroll-associated virus 2]WRX05844.1 Hsp70h [Grapevine leafroll-associated virus 2]
MVVFGLDFGTTFSTVCVYKDGKVYSFKQNNSAYIPTYLYLFSETNHMVFGYEAESLMHNAKVRGSFFRDLKRWVGCDSSNFSDYFDRLKPHYAVRPYKIGTGLNDTVIIGNYGGTVRSEVHLPGLIASFIKAMVSCAENAFSCTCTGVICSVPANYDSVQRNFTDQCVSLSGYQCVYMVNEPSAAALSACNLINKKSANLAVYDFGGGTFDVSIISYRNNTFVVRASGGDLNLGGRDVDRAFLTHLFSLTSLEPDLSLDISNLKESLSKTDAEIVYTLKGSDDKKEDVRVNKSILTTVMLPYVNRTLNILEATLKSYAKNMGGLRSVKCDLVLIGGSSYLPGLEDILSKHRRIDRILKVADPRAAVAVGCALYSSCLSGSQGLLLVDCAAHTIAIAGMSCDQIICAPAGAPIPFSGTTPLYLPKANRNSQRQIAVFEGEYVKCPRNRKICGSNIKFLDIGVTSVSYSPITFYLDVTISSVGAISFVVRGPEGKEVSLTGTPAYNFSSVVLGTRSVRELHISLSNKVHLGLLLHRKADRRLLFSEGEAVRYVETVEVADVLKEFKSYNASSLPPDEDVEPLMGKSVQKVLRGGRLEEIPL